MLKYAEFFFYHKVKILRSLVLQLKLINEGDKLGTRPNP
jgi:hypothetical protein